MITKYSTRGRAEPLTWQARRDRRPMGRAAERARARAEFIAAAAIDHGVHIAVFGNARDPCVSTWAPGATSVDRQVACQESFKRAVESNLAAVIAIGLAAKGRA